MTLPSDGEIAQFVLWSAFALFFPAWLAIVFYRRNQSIVKAIAISVTLSVLIHAALSGLLYYYLKSF